MASAPRKTVLITGCSEGGLGFALAQAFADAGYHVYATARNPGKAASLTGSSAHVELLQLDVTSAESIAACAADVRQRTSHAGRRGLDVLVNNAGVGLIMPLLDTPIQEGRKLYEVNVWGMLAVTQAFAPLLLEAKGVVLNISSIAGAVRMAWQGVYNASKASLTFLSETLRIELEPLGVRVVTAMVGEVATGFYAHSPATDAFALPPGSHYKSVEAIIGKQGAGELQTNNESAEVVARNIVRDVVVGRKGQIWRGGVAGTAKYASWLLPTRLFEWVLHQGRGVYEINHI